MVEFTQFDVTSGFVGVMSNGIASSESPYSTQ
jgi:hypothetical protein